MAAKNEVHLPIGGLIETLQVTVSVYQDSEVSVPRDRKLENAAGSPVATGNRNPA
jgi:hypothetical protein